MRALGVEQLEDRALLRVVGLRRVARRRADAAVALAQEVLERRTARPSRSPTPRARAGGAARRTPRRAGRSAPSRGAPRSRRGRPRARGRPRRAPCPVVTTKTPTWSERPDACGATKSASARHGSSPRRARPAGAACGGPPSSRSAPRARRSRRRRRPRCAGKIPATPRGPGRLRSRTSRSSIAFASAKSLRAATPIFASSRIDGIAPLQLPGLEERRPVDVRDELAERVVVVDEQPRRPASSRGTVAQSRRERPPPRLLERARCGPRLPGRVLACAGAPASPRTSRGERLASLRREEPARDRRRRGTASATWTTGPAYSGAIRTAVWAADVVAPPIRSGVVRARARSSPGRRAPSRRATA